MPAMRVDSAFPETCEAFERLSESVLGGRSGRSFTACRKDGRAAGAGLRWSPGCKGSTTPWTCDSGSGRSTLRPLSVSRPAPSTVATISAASDVESPGGLRASSRGRLGLRWTANEGAW